MISEVYYLVVLFVNFHSRLSLKLCDVQDVCTKPTTVHRFMYWLYLFSVSISFAHYMNRYMCKICIEFRFLWQLRGY